MKLFNKALTVLALSILPYAGLTSLGLVNPSFATGFTVSNVSFDNSTGDYSFDFSGFGFDSTAIQTIRITDNPPSPNWIESDFSPSCTGGVTSDSGHCSGTVGSRTGTFTCSFSTLNFIMDNSSTSEWSQAFTNPDPSCSATPTPTPTPTTAVIAVSPDSGSQTVGTPFNVAIEVNSTAGAFNAAKATVTVSSNLTISGIHSAPSPACNFQYTQTPTTSDASFAGAIFGSSATSCNVYTLTLTPNSSGTGTITITNGSIKAYSDSSEILTSVQNGSYTIAGATPTPTPTPPLSQLSVTSPLLTYLSSYPFAGTKDSAITHVFVNGSETGVSFPTSTTWQVTESLSSGDNSFTIYGSDGTNSTATQTIHVNLHTLGDINGDGVVDLTDASLFAVDYGKTNPSTFTYILSDMNNDGVVDLTDFSILAKLESN